MGKGRNKGMKRSHLKRWASDNIQVKGSTRARANMPQRRLYTGNIHAPNEYLEARFVGKTISEVELILRGMGDNPVPRGQVLAQIQEWHNNVPSYRHIVLKRTARIVDKLFFSEDGKMFFFTREHVTLLMEQKSCTYVTRSRADTAYKNGTVDWRHKRTLADMLSSQESCLRP